MRFLVAPAAFKVQHLSGVIALHCADASSCTRKDFRAMSPAVGTEAAIGMKRASARSPGSSEMAKATPVPVRV